MESAYRELCGARLILISLCISCVWVLFLTVAGPGSELLSKPGERAAYFGAIAALSWPLGHSMAIAVLYFMRRCGNCSVVLASVAAGLYVAANIAVVAYALYVLMRPNGPPPPGWALFYVRAAVASVVHFAAIHYLAVQRARLRPLIEGEEENVRTDHDGRPVTTSEIAPAGAPELPGRFLDRLPEEIGRDVVYLKVNGHYINVNTTSGTAAVLMRFADAVAELGDSGLQVHRSFWVANRHVTEVARRDDRTVIRVTGGEEVPVSRTFLATVRNLEADKRDDAAQPRSVRAAHAVHDTEMVGR